MRHLPLLLISLMLMDSAQPCVAVSAGDEMPNPIISTALADPSVIVHDGRLYLFATKDPWGGEDLACYSTADFKTWENHPLNWPTYAACESPTKRDSRVWAPEIIRGPDGRFYLYVSVGSEVYGGVARHPLGPWENITGGNGPIISDQSEHGIHTIDASPFIDDDGRIYLFWGSGWNWVNGRCLVVELEADMHTFKGEPRDITPPGYFEAPHLIKRHDRYYLMYSDGKTIEKSYQVRYAVAHHPMGPFHEEGRNSPILTTDESREIWGPGHHSVFRLGDQDYIAYHRHQRPYDPTPLRRQVCFDRLDFDAEGWIKPVVPTDSGIRVPPGSLQPPEDAFSP